MKIKWFGHACFELESKSGVKVVTDPFEEKVGYDVPRIGADIVTVSHQHYDHNNVSSVVGNREVVGKVGKYKIDGVHIEGIGAFHDEVMGAKRGTSIIYIFNIDGIKVCHLGDLGHMPDDTLVEELQGIEVLLVPTGGTYTIDSSQAAELVKLLSPKIAIPMHYKTNKLKFELENVDAFVKHFENVVHLDANEVVINEASFEGGEKLIVFAGY